MGNKILEAVKALGGDLRNTENYSDIASISAVIGFARPDGEVNYYQAVKKTTIDSRWFVVCAISEFNKAAEQWLKEAYMHNAALDLEWDIDNVKNSPRARKLEYLIADKLMCYYGSVTPANSEFAVHGWTDICSVKEFIDYCNANKPKPITAPIFTQEMADAGELPPIGCECMYSLGGGECWYHCLLLDTGVAGVTIRCRHLETDSDLGIQFISHSESIKFKPIQSPRDKDINEACKLINAKCSEFNLNIYTSAAMKAVIEAMIDAGYRKVAEPKINR